MLTKNCWLAWTPGQEKHRHQEVRVRTLSSSSWIQGCWKGGERALKTNLAYFKILPTGVMHHCKYLLHCVVPVTPVIVAHHHYSLYLFVCERNLVAANCPFLCSLKISLHFLLHLWFWSLITPLCLLCLNALTLDFIIDF